MAEQNPKAAAQEALYAKIAEAAKAVDLQHGAPLAASTLKDLAEAYAWTTAQAQPH